MWPIGWGVGLDWQKRSVQNLPICSGRGMRRSARGRRWRGRSPCGTGSATWRSASSRHTREGEEHDDQQRACPRRVWALLSHARLVNLVDVTYGRHLNMFDAQVWKPYPGRSLRAIFKRQRLPTSWKSFPNLRTRDRISPEAPRNRGCGENLHIYILLRVALHNLVGSFRPFWNRGHIKHSRGT